MAIVINSNQRRIMIITSDERIVEQIRTNNNPSSFQTIILEPEENNNEPSDPSAKLFCRHNNECEIKSETRRRCLTCRLNKCLNSGMKRWKKVTKRYKIKEKQNFILETNNQINEQKSQSLLSICSSHLLTSRDANVTQLLPQVSFQSQRAMLSSEDFERIEAVRIAFEKRIELAARDGLQWNPSIFATNLSQHLNARSVPAMHLLAFFKQIPEFNQLNVDDKIILTKYNLMSLIILNCALSFKIDTKQIIETDTDVPWNSSILRTVHGNEIYMQITKIFEPFVHIAKYDQKIIQLALIVLILTKDLSTGDGAPEPILNEGMAVYHARNSYIELLWKYMEIVYDFEQAFRIMTNLITRFLTWQIIEKKLRHNVEQNLSTADENDMLPLMKSLFHTS